MVTFSIADNCVISISKRNQNVTNKQKKTKKTNTLAPPQPVRLTRSTPGLFWMIKQVIPDFSTVTLFHVRQVGTKIFPENLGYAHKVDEYMAAYGGHKKDGFISFVKTE
jgi:hypothetical protein